MVVVGSTVVVGTVVVGSTVVVWIVVVGSTVVVGSIVVVGHSQNCTSVSLPGQGKPPSPDGGGLSHSLVLVSLLFGQSHDQALHEPQPPSSGGFNQKMVFF